LVRQPRLGIGLGFGIGLRRGGRVGCSLLLQAIELFLHQPELLLQSAISASAEFADCALTCDPKNVATTAIAIFVLRLAIPIEMPSPWYDLNRVEKWRMFAALEAMDIDPYRDGYWPSAFLTPCQT
jgi:hypothetical protein